VAETTLRLPTRRVAEFVTTEIRGARREISAQRALTKLAPEINCNALLA
jgi:hypothetical protein